MFFPLQDTLIMQYNIFGTNTRFAARYGFIDETCPSTFCKIMDIIPSTELRNIGLSFSRMLFYKDTGEVSEEVYDVLLYQILSEHSNRQAQEEFYNACSTGDVELKNAYHQQFIQLQYEFIHMHL